MSEPKWVPCERAGCTCQDYEQGPRETFPLLSDTDPPITYTVNMCGTCGHDPAWHIHLRPRPTTIR